MRNLDEMTITQAVLANNSGIGDARLCEIMTSLVQNLHAFARDIKLTEAEWQRGIDYLGQVGEVSSSDRNEFALLSHVLGLSTLVLAQHDKKPTGCTEATAFHVLPEQAPLLHDLGADLKAGSNEPKGYVHGSVLDAKGVPVPHASMEVHLAGIDSANPINRALLQADERGHYHFCTSLPDNHRIRHDSPVGRILAALNRPAWRPAHLGFTVRAAGYQPLTTQVFREGDPHLDSDPLFSVRSSLITQWQRHAPGMTPTGTHSDVPFYTLAFDFVMAKA